MTVENYIKTCPSCHQEYEANRLNQKFCSMKCKARYNNGKAKENKRKMETIVGEDNAILWANRQLLKSHTRKSLTLEYMDELGFKFGYVTRFKVDDEGLNNLYCYDYKYKFVEGNTQIKITKA